MEFLKKHKVLIIILLAIIIRLALLFLDFSIDVNNHIVWGKDLWQRGFPAFYETWSSESYASHYPNYPAVINYVFYVIYLLYLGLQQAVWWINTTVPIFPSKLVFFVSSRAFEAGLFKIPAVLFDFGIAWISYLFAKKLAPKKQNLQAIIFAYVLLNPVYFYVSAFWGQIDSIPLFFALASFYLIWFSKKTFWATILFTIGLLIKPNILVFLPIYAIVLFQRRKWWEVLRAWAVCLIVFWLTFLPFYKSGNIFIFPFEMYVEKVLLAQSLSFTSNSALNAWVLITGWSKQDRFPFIWNLSYQTWGFIMTGVLYLILIKNYFKKKDDVGHFLHTAFLMAFASFLFLTKMHERYLLLTLPFLFLTAIKKPQMMKYYVMLTTLTFLNLFQSWQAIPIEILKKGISTMAASIILSAINVILFFYLLLTFCNKKLLHFSLKFK